MTTKTTTVNCVPLGGSVTTTAGVIVRCRKCGGILFAAPAGALKSAALLQCAVCAQRRLLRPAYMIVKADAGGEDAN